MIMFYRLSILITMAFLCGCAVTFLQEKNPKLEITAIDQGAGGNPSISGLELRCPNGDVAFMMSPIIPLPPIIPNVWPDKSESVLRIPDSSSHGELTNIRIFSAKPDDVVVWDSLVTTTDREKGVLRIPHSCSFLDGHRLELIFSDSITGQETVVVLRLKYIKGELELEWGYLSA